MIDVDKNGLNIKIRTHILTPDEMKRIGFTDNNPYVWYYCKIIPFQNKKKYKNVKISFNVSIPKNGDRPRIDVLDEAFLQPYDYQSMLENGSFEAPMLVREFVEKEMNYLQNSGVLSGHEYGEYI